MDFLQELSQGKITMHIKNIKEGKKPYITVITFHNWIFLSIYPNLSPDKDANKRIS